LQWSRDRSLVRRSSPVSSGDGGEEQGTPDGPAEATRVDAPIELDSAAPALAYWLIFSGYLLLILILGFHLASFVFVAGFLLLDGDTRWPVALAAAAGIMGLFLVLERTYGLSLPSPFWS
jgi:uncharacterized integral membrane protein